MQATQRITKALVESLTTTELLESWDISLRSQGKSGRTIESYYLAVTQLDAHVGGKPPAEIARTDIEGFLAQVLATRASATARQRYASLKQFFKWLEEENEIPSNPMEKMKPPKVVEKPVPVLTTDEIRRLLAACKAGPPFEAARDTALILMFLDTGVRLASNKPTSTSNSKWLSSPGKGLKCGQSLTAGPPPPRSTGTGGDDAATSSQIRPLSGSARRATSPVQESLNCLSGDAVMLTSSESTPTNSDTRSLTGGSPPAGTKATFNGSPDGHPGR